MHDRQSNPRFKPFGKTDPEGIPPAARDARAGRLADRGAGRARGPARGRGRQLLPAGRRRAQGPFDADQHQDDLRGDGAVAGRPQAAPGRCLPQRPRGRQRPECRRSWCSRPADLAEDAVPEGIAALFSCNSEQRSFEDPKLRHGIFFYQVIKAWEGAADLDRDGQVTLEEMESFVRRETKTHARDALSTIQTPVFRVDRQAAKAGWWRRWRSATEPTAPRSANSSIGPRRCGGRATTRRQA